LSPEFNMEIRRVLKELGLTLYESSVYMALIEQGVLSASEVSEGTQVPFSKVYEVLNSLERKGWVDVEQGRPRRYFPKPPSEAFEVAKRRLEEKLEVWEKAFHQELQPLYEKREMRERPDIWILRGEAGVLSKLHEMLSRIRSEVMIAAPEFVSGLARKAAPLLGSLGVGNVKVSIMITDRLEGLSGIEHLGNVEVRRRDHLFGGGVIADRREVLLFLGEEEKPVLVVWSNHIGLVKFASDYFQYLWNSSTI
jgi:sugar-specific transcriptional regulator TrmB